MDIFWNSPIHCNLDENVADLFLSLKGTNLIISGPKMEIGHN